MNRKIALAILLGVLVVAGVWALLHSHWFGDLYAEYVLDNRYHHVPCQELPSKEEIWRVLQEHQDVLQQIQALDQPGVVGYEIVPCAPGHASLTFWYASHEQRVKIEEIIGGDTFFGVPYDLQNR